MRVGGGKRDNESPDNLAGQYVGGKETHEIRFQEHVVNRRPLQQGPCFERKRYGMVAGGGLGKGQLAKLQIGREFQQGHVHTTQPMYMDGLKPCHLWPVPSLRHG